VGADDVAGSVALPADGDASAAEAVVLALSS
jgi:hypothetical protein